MKQYESSTNSKGVAFERTTTTNIFNRRILYTFSAKAGTNMHNHRFNFYSKSNFSGIALFTFTYDFHKYSRPIKWYVTHLCFCAGIFFFLSKHYASNWWLHWDLMSLFWQPSQGTALPEIPICLIILYSGGMPVYREILPRDQRKHVKSMDHFAIAPSQRETTLQCNVVSHWLDAYTK